MSVNPYPVLSRLISIALAASAPSTVSARESEAAAPAAQFVTLGTGGGPVMRLKRGQPANAVVVGDNIYLFDTGDGVESAMLAAKLPLSKVKAVFLSHHHVDHMGGLTSLLIDRWVLGTQSPLPLIGPPGTEKIGKAIGDGFTATEYATDTLGRERPSLASSIAAKDMPADLNTPRLVYQDANIRVTAVTNAHYHYPAGSPAALHARSYSFRIEAGGRAMVYTGDTGISPSVERLAKGADLLVSEVMDADAIRKALSHQPGLSPDAATKMVDNMSRDHLLPEEVGDLARKAGVKAVVLTHLVPGRDDESDPDQYARGVRQHFSGPVTVATDLDRF